MRAPILALLLLFACIPAQGRAYRLCVDSNDWATYTHPDRDGSLQVLVRAALAKQGDSVAYVPLPWLRCEAMAESGAIDGLLGVPGTAAARERFAFPLSRGLIDSTRAVAAVDLVLMTLAGSGVEWDGKRLAGLKDKVAYVHGYDEIGERLDAFGIPHSNYYRSDMQDLKALIAGRTNVIATYAESATLLLDQLDYKGRVERLEPSLGHIFYFVAFNRSLYDSEHDHIEALWKRISTLRDAS